jgi:hypothetical protein
MRKGTQLPTITIGARISLISHTALERYGEDLGKRLKIGIAPGRLIVYLAEERLHEIGYLNVKSSTDHAITHATFFNLIYFATTFKVVVPEWLIEPEVATTLIV